MLLVAKMGLLYVNFINYKSTKENVLQAKVFARISAENLLSKSLDLPLSSATVQHVFCNILNHVVVYSTRLIQTFYYIWTFIQ